MTESAKLRLPYIAASQAQKHVTHNEALTLLDTLCQASVIDKDLTTPPVSPAEGDCYIVAATGTGAWTGWDGRIARFIDGEWRSYLPGAGGGEGWLVYVQDEANLYVLVGGTWTLFASSAQPLDADLTDIAALSPVQTTMSSSARPAPGPIGRWRSSFPISAALGTTFQPLDSDLTAIAALSPSNDDVVQRKAGAWTNRTLAQLISDLAALGTTFQPLDSDLTAIAALSPSNDDVVQRKSGVWTKRTMAQLMADLGALGQIPFPATQNPSADANTLDDYEEGSWTPTFITTGTQPTGVTYTLQLGRYIKIGTCVLFWFRLQLSSVGTGGTGNGRVGGLPFVVAAGSGIYNVGLCRRECHARQWLFLDLCRSTRNSFRSQFHAKRIECWDYRNTLRQLHQHRRSSRHRQHIRCNDGPKIRSKTDGLRRNDDRRRAGGGARRRLFAGAGRHRHPARWDARPEPAAKISPLRAAARRRPHRQARARCGHRQCGVDRGGGAGLGCGAISFERIG